MGVNLKMLPFNRWSDTSLGSIFSSGAQSGYPASDTQVQQRSARWRSADLVYPVWLKRDLGISYRIGSISIVAHNLTRAGKVRAVISDNVNMSSPLLDKTVNAWENLWPSGEEPDYTGSGLASEYVDGNGLPLAVAISALPEPVLYISFTEVSGRYIEIHFDDASNGDGYIEVAYVYAGMVIEADINYSRLRVTQVDSARIAEAASGQPWMTSVYKKTEVEATLELQPESKALGFWMFAFSHLGVSREFIVVFRDQAAKWRFWLVLYAHFKQTPRMTGTHFERYSFPVEIEELVG